MLTDAWKQLRYHELQSKLWRSPARDVKVCAGRGSGKTELARRRIVRCLRLRKPWRDPRYFYAMPTYGQCKRVARDQILSLIPPGWLTKTPGETTMEFKTVFGSWLFLVGMDKPERLEGDQYDGGVIDESSDQKPGVWAKTVRPALTHREGWGWRIGVPKRQGPGANEFRSAFERGTMGVDSFHWPSWDILSADEIDRLSHELTEKDFNEQIGGRWEDAGGAAYYAFMQRNWPEGNLDPTADYNPDWPVFVGTDFNVDPMAWVLAHRSPINNSLLVFDEVWIRNTNTQATLDALWKKYGAQQQSGWFFTGDATSRNRHTSASVSDYAQITSDERFKARVKYDKANPAIKDRLAAVNTLLCTKAGERRLLVHPRCVHLIEDLKTRALDEDGNPAPAEPGQAHDSGHMTDALGYLVHRYYPLQNSLPGQRLILVG